MARSRDSGASPPLEQSDPGGRVGSGRTSTGASAPDAWVGVGDGVGCGVAGGVAAAVAVTPLCVGVGFAEGDVAGVERADRTSANTAIGRRSSAVRSLVRMRTNLLLTDPTDVRDADGVATHHDQPALASGLITV
jgi:hypothetical protein